MWWSKKKEKVPTVNEVVDQIKNDPWFTNLVDRTTEVKVKITMFNLVKYFEEAYKPYAPEMATYGDHRGEERDAKEGMASFGRYVDGKVQRSYQEFVQRDLDNKVQIKVDMIVEELKTYLNQEKLLDDIVARLKNKQLSQ